MKTTIMTGTVSFACMATAAVAQPLPLAGDIVLADANVATFDPVTFTPGPDVDVWQVVASNPNVSGDATSLAPVLEGPWINLFPQPFTFSTEASLPVLGPNVVAESFFVIPDAGGIISQFVTDETGLLTAEYTLPGPMPFVAAGDTSVLAILSTPAGAASRGGLLPGLSGRAVIDGQFVDIIFPVPEPTAALLGVACVMTGLVAGTGRRRTA